MNTKMYRPISLEATAAIVLAVALTSCSSSDRSDREFHFAHQVNKLAGYYPSIGDEIPVSAARELPTQVRFPHRVTSVYIPKDAPVRVGKVGKSGDILYVQALPELAEEGMAVPVRTIEAKEYILRVTPRSREAADKIVRVDPLKRPASTEMRARIRIEESVQLVDLGTRVSKMLSQLKKASGNATEFKRYNEAIGRRRIDNTIVGALVTDAYQNGDLVGYKLEVLNRTDYPLPLVDKLFASPRTVAIETSNEVAPAAPPRLGVLTREDSHLKVLVYVVERI